ncbi:hypothetical protein, partial [Streptomyces achromogenes]|uniref:hypothetical protein n=1 Tax=Streptomyces achromogenes TaxID=67255 RepID=UPI003F4CC376
MVRVTAEASERLMDRPCSGLKVGRSVSVARRAARIRSAIRAELHTVGDKTDGITTSFSQAAREEADSRVWLGVHYPWDA